MNIKGRGIIEPYHRLAYAQGKYQLRIDDHRILETWVEIEITEADLAAARSNEIVEATDDQCCAYCHELIHQVNGVWLDNEPVRPEICLAVTCPDFNHKPVEADGSST